MFAGKNSHIHHSRKRNNLLSISFGERVQTWSIKILNIKSYWIKKSFLTRKSGRKINFAYSGQYLLSHFLIYIFISSLDILLLCHHKFRQHTLSLNTCKSNKLYWYMCQNNCDHNRNENHTLCKYIYFLSRISVFKYSNFLGCLKNFLTLTK